MCIITRNTTTKGRGEHHSITIGLFSFFGYFRSESDKIPKDTIPVWRYEGRNQVFQAFFSESTNMATKNVPNLIYPQDGSCKVRGYVPHNQLYQFRRAGFYLYGGVASNQEYAPNHT